MRSIFVGVCAIVFFVCGVISVHAQEETVTIYFFGRDDCGHCADEKEFLRTYAKEDASIRYEYFNVITDSHAASVFTQLTEKHGLPRITPLTVIGETVIQGFDTTETTGLRIREAVERARLGDIRTIDDHLARAPRQTILTVSAGCDSGDVCTSLTNPNASVFNLPFVGVVDLKTFSLFSLSAILGIVDGFNPCAMWVLITFLVLLSQIGDKRKMILVAGVFILAEAIMYNLILNVWFTAWDFVGLDAIVTPLIGMLAVGGGVFFLYRYRKNRNTTLTCDISDIDTQANTVNRIKDLVLRPTSIAVVLGVIAIAFSVNIIEFACSIGIPQAYTKILEMNDLNTFARQMYLMVYTLGYMVDDVVVFGLAIWGFSRLEAHGHRYAQLSLLIGGILMLILGMLLVFEPSFLVL